MGDIDAPLAQERAGASLGQSDAIAARRMTGRAQVGEASSPAEAAEKRSTRSERRLEARVAARLQAPAVRKATEAEQTLPQESAAGKVEARAREPEPRPVARPGAERGPPMRLDRRPSPAVSGETRSPAFSGGRPKKASSAQRPPAFAAGAGFGGEAPPSAHPPTGLAGLTQKMFAPYSSISGRNASLSPAIAGHAKRVLSALRAARAWGVFAKQAAALSLESAAACMSNAASSRAQFNSLMGGVAQLALRGTAVCLAGQKASKHRIGDKGDADTEQTNEKAKKTGTGFGSAISGIFSRIGKSMTRGGPDKDYKMRRKDYENLTQEDIDDMTPEAREEYDNYLEARRLRDERGVPEMDEDALDNMYGVNITDTAIEYVPVKSDSDAEEPRIAANLKARTSTNITFDETDPHNQKFAFYTTPPSPGQEPGAPAADEIGGDDL